jgi:hypothetical protein
LGSRFVSGVIVAGLLSAGGCASRGDDLDVRVMLVDRSSHALAAASLESVNGTYGAGCVNRAGDPWSLPVAADPDLEHAELSVVKNNAACVLTLTELVTLDGPLEATPAIVLTTAYVMAASTFGSPPEFYANAKLSAVSFASNFTLTVLYSDDADLATDEHTADFAVQTGTVTAGSVPAPDHMLNLGDLVIQTDVNDVVQTATGNVDLSGSTVAGTRYAVVDAAGLDTYDEIDDAFRGATSATIVAEILAAAFDLVGDDLTSTQVRTLIIANISNDVNSYQVFEITFNPPVRI